MASRKRLADRRVVFVSWRPWFRIYTEGGYDGFWSFGRRVPCDNIDLMLRIRECGGG